MVKELNDQRRVRSQKVSQVRSILRMSATYADLIFQKYTVTSTPAAIADVPLAAISKLTTS